MNARVKEPVMESVQRIFVPCKSADAWKGFLADESHWKTGYSARTLAHCWQDAQGTDRGLPSEIASAVDAIPRLAGLTLVIGVPEHRVALPGGRRASQTDFWFLGATREETVSVAVEGKVHEPFGPTVGEWLASASSGSGRPARLAALCDIIGIPPDVEVAPIRYQLLHRTASAILEARRFRAAVALMLVHSFTDAANFDQFSAFTGLLGHTCTAPGIVSIEGSRTVPLFVGWVSGAPRWLKK